MTNVSLNAMNTIGHILGTMAMAGILFLWCAVFWLPLKKYSMLHCFVWVPAAVATYLMLRVTSDSHWNTWASFITWCAIPAAIIVTEILWKRSKDRQKKATHCHVAGRGWL